MLEHTTSFHNTTHGLLRSLATVIFKILLLKNDLASRAEIVSGLKDKVENLSENGLALLVYLIAYTMYDFCSEARNYGCLLGVILLAAMTLLRANAHKNSNFSSGVPK